MKRDLSSHSIIDESRRITQVYVTAKIKRNLVRKSNCLKVALELIKHY